MKRKKSQTAQTATKRYKTSNRILGNDIRKIRLKMNSNLTSWNQFTQIGCDDLDAYITKTTTCRKSTFKYFNFIAVTFSKVDLPWVHFVWEVTTIENYSLRSLRLNHWARFQEFEPTIEMMMNDFDDERTMEEEEALEANEDDEADELSALEQEQVRPIVHCRT